MSILLDGIFSESDSPTLQGMWHFASSKDGVKNVPLKYSFKWKSDSIPKSLYDRLAFHLTEEEVKEKHKSLKRSSSSSTTHVGQADLSHEEIERDLSLGTGAVDKYLPDQQTIVTASMAGIENAIPNAEFKVIDRKHPLFGMWEGKFEYIPGQPEHLVDEIFFIHQYVGFDSPPSLSDLPFEPSFSYSLLGVDDFSIRHFIKSLDPNYEFYADITKKTSFNQSSQM
jgi:hypothetical protein